MIHSMENLLIILSFCIINIGKLCKNQGKTIEKFDQRGNIQRHFQTFITFFPLGADITKDPSQCQIPSNVYRADFIKTAGDVNWALGLKFVAIFFLKGKIKKYSVFLSINVKFSGKLN